MRGGNELDTNRLFYGDNLPVLREYFPPESVDLIYLDPPFNSNRSYSAIFADESGRKSDAQIHAFEDSWHWGPSAENHYAYLTNTAFHQGAVPSSVSAIVSSLRFGIGETPMLAYVVEMAVRLVELRRVLRPTGSLYLHCDPTASHYLKVVLDALFGATNFRSEIVWQRTTAHSDSKEWSAVSDRILYYVKDRRTKFTWNPQHIAFDERYLDDKYRNRDPDGRRFTLSDMTSPSPRPNMMYEWRGHASPPLGWRYELATMERLDAEGRIWYPDSKDKRPRLKRYLDEIPGSIVTNVWTDIPPVNSQAKERLGYPTQKPVALLERILSASSNPGDIVLDPFCGCGTALVASEKMGRRWLGIDITYLAIATMRQRLRDTFGTASIPVIGQPTEVAGARMLAEAGPEGRYQFQWWALDAIGASPHGDERKKGSDTGIDGRITFSGSGGVMEQAIVSVKSGKPKADDVRVLKSVIERERAAIGILISLDEPTSAMRHEATLSGTYVSELSGKKMPRIQLLSAADIIERGLRPQLPPLVYGAYQKAERVAPKVDQQALFAE